MILVIGSSNTDLVLPCDRLPKPGETVLAGALQRFAGGKGANQAVAAARAGARVTFVGARGDDDFGRAAAAGLAAEGIDIAHFRVLPKHTSGTALILLGGKERQNLIAVATSANDALTPALLAPVKPLFAQAKVVVTQLETPLSVVLAAAKLARRARVPFILNPAPAQKLPAELLALVDVITPNEHEALLVTGKKTLDQAAAALLNAGVKNVVITLGEKGAVLHRAEQKPVHVPAKKVKPVDTVGAGDCFNGWLAAGLAAGQPIEEALRRAALAASIKVTRPGAQAGMPRARDVR